MAPKRMPAHRTGHLIATLMKGACTGVSSETEVFGCVQASGSYCSSLPSMHWHPRMLDPFEASVYCRVLAGHDLQDDWPDSSW